MVNMHIFNVHLLNADKQIHLGTPSPSQDKEHFHHPRKLPYPFPVILSPYPTKCNHCSDLFHHLFVCLFCSVLYMESCSLCSFKQMPFGHHIDFETHCFCVHWHTFFFYCAGFAVEQYSVMWTHHSLPIFLGCSLLWALRNKASISIIEVFLQTCFHFSWAQGQNCWALGLMCVQPDFFSKEVVLFHTAINTLQEFWLLHILTSQFGF